MLASPPQPAMAMGVEIDVFDSSLGSIEFEMPDGSMETVELSGTSSMQVFFEGTEEGTAGDNDGDSRDEVEARLVDFNLVGLSPTLGPVNVHLNPDIPSFTVININQGNQPPVADPNGPYIVDQGSDVALNASGSYDPDEAAGDSIISYEWDLDNDGMFDYAGATIIIPWADITSMGMAYPADPTTGLPSNTIRLRVTDTFGATSTGTATLTIYANQPFASFTASPNPAAPGQVITFDASGSYHGRPDRSIVLYEWDFDYDGSFDIDASGIEVTHAYTAFGSYTVALRVADDDGSTDIASLSVTVLSPEVMVEALINVVDTIDDLPEATKDSLCVSLDTALKV